jgi:hypothetical protein
MGKRQSTKRSLSRRQARLLRESRDAQYRSALGVAPGEPLPPVVGTANSAGSARGGRGASQKGRGVNK